MINQDIEASVIGALLLGGLTPDASEVLGVMNPDDFFVPLYRKTFIEIRRHAKQRNLIDGLMIAESMSDNFADVAETMRSCASAANLKGYAQVVMKTAIVRNFLAEMEQAKVSINTAANHEQALTAVTEAMNKFSQINKPTEETKPLHIRDILEGYQDLLEKRLTMGEASDTLKTGISELDEITGGINPVDFVVVAARPGMGKTEFALTVAEGVSRQKIYGSDMNRGVLLFSMEMDANQIVERQLAGAGNLPVSSLRKPARMSDEQWTKVTIGLGKLLELDVWIVDASKMSVEQIRAISERHKRTHPALSLIMVDYLGLIDKPKAERNDLAIAHISGSLKRMAKDLRTPVMSLSQLSRDVEKRPNKRPVNADLRDSGSVEQDADSIIMLYRDVVYNENSPMAKYAEIIVTKNRFGELGTVYQQFLNGHFKPCDQEEARRASKGQSETQGKRFAKAANV